METGLYEIETPSSRQNQAKAAARMIYYAAHEAGDLGLGECRQLLLFCANLMRIKYGLQDREVLCDANRQICRQ